LDVHNPDTTFAEQFSVPAQTLLPQVPSTYRPPNSSATFYQQEHESLGYARIKNSQYRADAQIPYQHRADSWAAQGSSGTEIYSQPSQSLQV
jgi:hypothetical protein